MNLTKRQKIVISTIFISINLLVTFLVGPELRLKSMLTLLVLTYLLSLWSLWEGLTPIKAFVLLTLPAMYAFAMSSAYFVLPIRWLTRLPVIIFFGFSFYLLLLSQNIFNVASIRTIPLYRAASTVSFVATIFTALVAYTVIYTLRWLFLWNGLAAAAVSFPLILQNIWSVEMEDKVSAPALMQGLVISLIIGEIAVAFSFWPMQPLTWAIALVTTLYVILGIFLQYLRKRLSGEEVRVYLLVGGIIWSAIFLFTSWTG